MDKQTFVKLLNLIIRLDEKDQELSKHLQAYCEDKDFTGFFSSTPSEIASILKESMGDESDLISEWIWGDHDKITIESTGSDEKWEITSAESLYNYLNGDTLSMVEAQTNGVKFALKVLDNLADTNTQTHNDGWEDRTALLKLARDKIANDYVLKANLGELLDDEITTIEILKESN